MPRLTVEPVTLRLRHPIATAWGELRERELLHVRLEWADGSFGEGEAAPLEAYDGVSLHAVRAALDAHAAVLHASGDEPPHRRLLAACARERPLPQALAAIDLALWDRSGRAAGSPVAPLVAPGAHERIFVNALITAPDRAGAARQAARAAAAGYVCVKVKVGIGDDAGRVAAVRAAAGPRMAIRVDANGAWESVQEALAALRSLVSCGIELAEEPVHGVEALAELRELSPIPIGMDETGTDLAAVTAGAADAICLKIARSGGISPLLEQAAAARAAGAHVYVASSLDGPLGIAAGAHAAAALAATGPLAPCGLDTLALFEDAGPGPVIANGMLTVPTGPGLLGRTTGIDQGGAP